MPLPQPIHHLLFACAKIYWRLRKPHTFGVKAVIRADGQDDSLLLVRHTYGNTSLWNLPGGGYNPKRETPIDAIRREIEEELGVTPVGVRELGVYKTGGEGKVDTVRIFEAKIDDLSGMARASGELSEVAWVPMDAVFDRKDIARIVRTGVRQLRGENTLETYV